jgi:hypothetical protein
MIDVDERAWPLVVFRFRGQVSLEELNVYLARQDVLLARNELTVQLVLAQETKLWETPVLRRQAEWIKINRDVLGRHSLGVALVIDSPIVRGMLKAILWIQPMPLPHAVFRTVEEALRWLRERVTEANANIAVPERL